MVAYPSVDFARHFAWNTRCEQMKSDCLRALCTVDDTVPRAFALEPTVIGCRERSARSRIVDGNDSSYSFLGDAGLGKAAPLCNFDPTTFRPRSATRDIIVVVINKHVS